MDEMKTTKAFASSGPAGLMVLAFYLCGLFPVFTGLASSSAAIILVALGLGGATVQLTCGIISLKNHDILGGNMMMAFSGFMWLGCISNLLAFAGIGPSGGLDLVNGTVFLIMGIFMVGFTFQYVKMGIVPGLFMITTDIFFLGAAFSWLTGASVLMLIAGWDIPLVVLCIIYLVLTEVYGTLKNEQSALVGTPANSAEKEKSLI